MNDLSKYKTQYGSIVDLHRDHAERYADHPSFTFLEKGEEPGKHLTHKTLDLEAKEIAAYLQHHYSDFRKKRALLLYPQGLEFIRTFLGCLYAGVLAVPINYGVLSVSGTKRFETIANDSQVDMVLTTGETIRNNYSKYLDTKTLGSIQWIATDEIDRDLDYSPVAIKPEDLAFLQYTSGSTALPKGIMISHLNILDNCYHYQQTAGNTRESCMVTWLPHFHDMGLIIGILQSIFTGMHCVQMSPLSFIKKPYRWLKAISDYKGTVSAAPNFAYEICSRKIDKQQIATLDLSSWEVTLNGAEPIYYETLQRFTKVFEPAGFKYNTFFPGYGLAEATIAVTTSLNMRGPKVLNVDKKVIGEGKVVSLPMDDESGRHIVGCGIPLPNIKLLIVNPDTKIQCADDEVGEIWLQCGDSMPAGYWKRPEESRETYGGYLADTDEGPFLRTGDIGFMQDNELYFSGRLKDIIIIRGVNYYPQDIELTVQNSHPVLHRGDVAVFSISKDKEERMVIVKELRITDKKLNTRDVIKAINQKVLEEHNITPYAIVLVEAGSILKTSSGKIQRRACKSSFKKQQLQVIDSWQIDDNKSLLDYIDRQIHRWLNEDSEEPDHLDEGLMILGLDSLLAFELQARLKRQFGIELPIKDIARKTLYELITEIRHRMNEGDIGAAGEKLPEIVPENENRYLPFALTDVQHAYWFGRNKNLELGNVSCHFYVEVEVKQLDIPRFNNALNKLIQRHEMLKAVVLEDGRQQILETVPNYEVAVTDMKDMENDFVESRVKEIRADMSHQVLNAEEWPLFDIRATVIESDKTCLHISMDLLIADGWSFTTMIKDLGKLYNGEELEPLTLSFRDYVSAQETVKESAAYRRSLDYWKAREIFPTPELPLAKQPYQIDVPRFVRRQAKIEKALWNRLKQRGEVLGVTPSALLISAFSLILAKWSQQSRFSIVLTLFNRLMMHPEVNDVVGDFTTLVLLGIEDHPEKGFGDFALSLQEQLWNDLEHRYVSGIQVVRETAAVKQERLASYPVVFTSIIPYGGSEKMELPVELPMKINHCISQTPQVYLDHQVMEADGNLILAWDAVEEIFPAGLLDNMFNEYHALLLRLAGKNEKWERPCLEFLRTDQSAHRIQYNETAAESTGEMLHTLFLARAAEQPDQPAVIDPERYITYRELAQRANNLAHTLREKGALPDKLIGIVMHKGWEQVIAAMGILIAGSAYVPISPVDPEERRNHLLQEGEVSIVLTQPDLEKEIHWPEGIQTIAVTGEKPVAVDTPDPVHNPVNLAYVIYTSGSTGKPKGVMIDHAGAVNTILDINKRFDIGPADRVLAVSDLNFDLSVFDIFGTLAAGGTLIIPAREQHREPAHWIEMMSAHQVTVWNSAPALMGMLTAYAEGLEKIPGCLRLAMLSGDWIPMEIPDRIRKHVPNANIVSLGGATEASIWSVYYPIETIDPNWKSIPYGYPLENQTLYVLDSHLETCPDWVPGYIYIGGSGLAKGYWKDKEKTERSFITHPETGERLYKTGDLGRFIPEGYLEFLGRDDFQVKIRGHRIELGEIEAVLNKCEGVKESVVTLANDASGNKNLAAYMVLDNEYRDQYGQTDRKRFPGGSTIHNPLERMKFKLQKKGLRTPLQESTIIDFRKINADEETIRKYSGRISRREFKNEPIAKDDFRKLLENICSVEPSEALFPKFRYGSAGGLYPVQTYLYIKPGSLEEISGGAYYFNPSENCLERLTDEILLSSVFPGNENMFQQASFVMFFAYDKDAIVPMYGERSRDFCLIEVGLMAQLLEESAFAVGLGLCQVGALEFERFYPLFKLEKRYEYLHCIMGGKVDAATDISFVDFMINSEESVKEKEDLTPVIRETISKQLPQYMIPSQFSVIEEMPLTSNGKVDRKKFVEIMPRSTGNLQKLGQYIQPESETEKAICDIIKEMLSLEQVSATANFFDLGVDSLLLVKIQNKIRKSLSINFPVVAFFEHSNPRTLSKYLVGAQIPTDGPSRQGKSRIQHKKLRSERRDKRKSQKNQKII